MIVHAVEVAGKGQKVHMYSQDTDVLLLALIWVQGKGKMEASQASLMQAPVFLLHLLNLEKMQNHQLWWSRDANSFYTHSAALNNSQIPNKDYRVASLQTTEI